jgi:beta-1,4-mannosyltransferase
MMADAERDAKVVVSPSIDEINPYLFSVFSRLPDHGFQAEAWRESSPLARVDVIHINWPDTHLGRESGAQGLKRYLQFISYLRLMQARGTKIVWTAHNLRPHQLKMPVSLWDARFKRLASLFDGVVHLTTASIELVQATFPVISDRPHAVVPHPHYGDVVRPVCAAPRQHLQRLVTFGRIEPYKRVPDALAAVSRLPSLTWTVAGECQDDGLRAQLAVNHPNVTIRYGRLSEPDMEGLAAEHDAVLITQPEFLNSGVLFLGLSLGLPVIAPENPSSLEIQAEVGPDWLRLYTLPLTREGLHPCLGRFGGGPPPLDQYEPDLVAARMSGFYRRLLKL